MTTGQTFGNIEPMSITIDTDLSDKTMYFVTLDTTDDKTVNLAADAAAPLYILADDGDGSSAAIAGSVVRDGRMKMKLGGTVAPGDKLTSDANGKAIKTVTDKDNFGAIAVVAGVLNDVVEVDVVRGMVSAV